MQPAGATFVPRETTGERAERIEVALQIRKRIIARRIVQTFFASLTGGADSEDGRLDRFAATQAIVAADFEEADVALAAVEVPFEGRGHGDDAGGLEDAGFFGKRIGEARGLYILLELGRTEEHVAIFCNVGNGENFAIAEADEAFAEARFGFIVRETRGALAGGGQARGKFIEAVDAGDFFDEVDFAFDFGAPGGLRALPGSEDGAFRAAILNDADGGEAEGAEAGLDLLDRKSVG